MEDDPEVITDEAFGTFYLVNAGIKTPANLYNVMLNNATDEPQLIGEIPTDRDDRPLAIRVYSAKGIERLDIEGITNIHEAFRKVVESYRAALDK